MSKLGTITRNHIIETSNFIVRCACEETESGNYCVFEDEIEKEFDISSEFVAEHRDEILEELRKRDEILEAVFDEDGAFDVICSLDYCPNYCWMDGDEDVFGCSYEEWLERPTREIIDTPYEDEEDDREIIERHWEGGGLYRIQYGEDNYGEISPVDDPRMFFAYELDELLEQHDCWVGNDMLDLSIVSIEKESVAATITDDELFREVRMRFPGRSCIWEDEDVAIKLEERGYEPSKENIEKVWGRAASDWLVDNMVEAGYDTIDNAIDWISEELTKATEE